ncbi:hypothetical protein MGH68_02690 [Erysipelothrix sp. D19-032]
MLGVDDISIGNTLNNVDHIDPLPPIIIEEPTLSMNFMVNASPFAGRDGKYVTSRNIKERLEKELEVNVGLRVDDTGSADSFKVSVVENFTYQSLLKTCVVKDTSLQFQNHKLLRKSLMARNMSQSKL